MPLKLAVLVSGGGSNLQSIIDRIEEGALDAEIRIVLSNKADAHGLERARKHSIPAMAIEHAAFPSREAFDAEMVRAIREAGADTVALAGFMRIITPVFLEAFPGRVVNIHPALLPSFPGVHGQGDAASYGVRISGCTVHFVDEKMDNGPIIIQAAVPALENDGGESLGARILRLEHRIYPQALQWLAEGRLAVSGRQVRLASSERTLAELRVPALVHPPLEQGF
ncbi:MAG: phosphoribosylglycinamide formyltransferase [Desulfovibrionaceae bacterium]